MLRGRSAIKGGRLVVQVAAFAIGIGLLAWFIHVALSPANKEKLQTLWRAPASDIAGLLGLSLLSLTLNGASFWIVLWPVRRLKLVDVEATNALASFLSYLPFKLSAVSRFVVHNRRDGVPLMTIAAWMGAAGAVIIAALTPPVAAGVWRGHVDLLFFVAMFGGLAVTYLLTLGLAMTFAHAAGLARLHRLLDPLRIKPLNYAMRTPWFHNLHAGFAMLAHPLTLAGAMACRGTDLIVQAARFALAAKVVGVELGWEGALLVATTYFVIGVMSPAGTLGTREGGATGMAALLHVPGLSAEGFVVVALVVSASEMIVQSTGGILGACWLRVDRLWGSRKSEAGSRK
jgi:hypothetical protein